MGGRGGREEVSSLNAAGRAQDVRRRRILPLPSTSSLLLGTLAGSACPRILLFQQHPPLLLAEMISGVRSVSKLVRDLVTLNHVCLQSE